LESVVQLKGRLNYEIQLKITEQKKSKIECWRNEYIRKYKRVTASSDSLFKLTNPINAPIQKYMSITRTTSVDDYSRLATGFAELNRMRVENVKRDHMKFQSNYYLLFRTYKAA
jgi:hypothetical protein